MPNPNEESQIMKSMFKEPPTLRKGTWVIDVVVNRTYKFVRLGTEFLGVRGRAIEIPLEGREDLDDLISVLVNARKLANELLAAKELANGK